MRVAGIRAMGASVEVVEVPEPRQLADDEVLIEVMAAGVGAGMSSPAPEAGTLAASRRWRWVSRRRERC
jgi:hypothetical protein